MSVVRKRADEDSEDLLLREVNILSRIHSPYVVQFYCVEVPPSSSDVPNIIEEFVPGGSLDNLAFGSKTADEMREILVQLVLAVDSIHRENIMHLDIKPANMIWDSERLVLIDFGAAVNLNTEYVEDFVCTLPYTAPELDPTEHYALTDGFPTNLLNFAADWFSVGVSIHNLFARNLYKPDQLDHAIEYPFDMGYLGLLRRSGKYIRLKTPKKFPREVADLVEKLTAHDPKRRLGHMFQGGVSGVMKHPYFQGVDWKRAMTRSSGKYFEVTRTDLTKRAKDPTRLVKLADVFPPTPVVDMMDWSWM